MRSPGEASFEQVLSRAMQQESMSLRGLQRALRERGHQVGLTTLSYWRSGERLPERHNSIAVVDAMEEVLGLQPGLLRAARGPSRRVGPPKLIPYHELARRSGGLSRLRSGLDLQAPPELDERSNQQVIKLDQHGRVISAASRAIWRARRDGARLFATYFVSDSSSAQTPEIRSISSCSVSSMEFDTSNQVLLAEMASPRNLRVNDTVITEYELIGPWTPQPETNWRFLAQSRMAECVLWIQFDPRLVPRRCTEFVSDADGVEHSWPVVVENAQLHCVRWHFGPGSFGFRWEF